MKKWILCIGCVIAIILGVTLISPIVTAKMNKQAIEEVLTQDKRKCKTAEERYGHMAGINLSKCPADFQQKYVAHTNAWREEARVIRKAKFFNEKYGTPAAWVESFLRGLYFDFSMTKAAFKEIEELRTQAERTSEMIKDTWHDVLACAAEYGVDTSKYR